MAVIFFLEPARLVRMFSSPAMPGIMSLACEKY
jgi:hypothetical protein